MDSNSRVSASTRQHDGNVFKELLEISNKFLVWLVAIITLKFTDTGEALFKANYSVLMGVVSISVLYYLALVLATMLQMHIRNLLPSLVILMLVCAASVSALTLSLISLAVAWVAFFLWLCIFALIGYYNHQELYQWILCRVPDRIKTLMGSDTPQNPVTQRV